MSMTMIRKAWDDQDEIGYRMIIIRRMTVATFVYMVNAS